MQAETGKQLNTGGLYVGSSPFVVTCLNPTKDELLVLTKKAVDEEPNYLIYDKEDKSKVIGVRFLFMLRNKTDKEMVQDTESPLIYTRVSYNMYNDELVSSAKGSKCFINNLGQSTWAKSKEELPDWFSKDGLKVSLKGENTIIKALKIILGTPATGNCSFDESDYQTFFSSGDVSGVKALLAKVPDNKIKYVLGVNTYTNSDGTEVQSQGVVANVPLYPNKDITDKIWEAIEYAQDSAGDYALEGLKYSDNIHKYSVAELPPELEDEEEEEISFGD